MRWRRLLIVLALALVVLPDLAWGQLRSRRSRVPPPSLLQLAAPSEPDAGGEEPTVEALLKRLEALESRAADRAAGRREKGLALMLEHSMLASTNYYGPDGIPYFITRLIVINLSDAATTIRPREIVLLADGKEHSLLAGIQRLSRRAVQIRGEVRTFEPPPESLEVPSRGSASVWLVYADLDSGARVPAMRLKVPGPDGLQELDVNAYQRGVLGMQVERLGPQNCAALLTVSGELNTINAADLADELEALASAGVARAVIGWGEASPRPGDQVFGWLLAGSARDMTMQYSLLPPLPASIRELHLVRPPALDPDRMYGFGYGQYVPLHGTNEEAVLAALRTAFEAVSRDDVRVELQRGHRLSRAAALKHGGARLGSRDLPLVLKACDEPDPLIQTSALAALGEFREPAAIERLQRAASAPEEAVWRAALESLAAARYPEAHRALQSCLEMMDPARRTAVVEVLARYPRPEWMARLVSYFEQEDPGLRLVALRALVRLGHPEVFEMLSQALASDDPELRAEAFAQLATRTDPASEALATEHALERLEQSPPDHNVYAVLSRTRDRRAVPLLLKHLDAARDGQDALIRLLGQVGGHEVVPELLSRYAQRSPAERSRLLEVLFELKVPEVRRLALEALGTGDSELISVAARILTAEPDSQTVPLLARALSAAQDPGCWSALCNALASIGDSAARQVLQQARRNSDPHKRAEAINALQRIKYSSPAYHYSGQALEALRSGDARKAEKLLDLALSFDPVYAEAFSQRGHLRLTNEQLDESLADFEHAVQLDPYDALAVTGRALVTVLLGRADEGVQQIQSSAERFVGDALFEYNAACVYGRAAERLPATPAASQELREQYQGLGLEHLRNSVRLGFSDFEHIRKDRDLEAFRGLQEFQELLAHPPADDAQPENAPPEQAPSDEIEFEPGSLR